MNIKTFINLKKPIDLFSFSDIIDLSNETNIVLKLIADTAVATLILFKRGYVMIVSDEKMAVIASYMDDEIREKVHNAIAPCSNEKFIFYYLLTTRNREEFEELLECEFDITYQDICTYLHSIKECEKIRKKIEGKIVEMEKIYELEMLQCVSSVINQGYSGNMIGYYWYEVELVNGDTFTIYCKE